MGREDDRSTANTTERLCLTPNNYQTVVNLVSKREEHNHPPLEVKGQFKGTMNNEWSKIKRIYKRLAYVMHQNPGLSEIEAAEKLDEERERLDKSMDQYVKYLRSTDSNAVKRNRKRQRVGNDNIEVGNDNIEIA